MLPLKVDATQDPTTLTGRLVLQQLIWYNACRTLLKGIEIWRTTGFSVRTPALLSKGSDMTTKWNMKPCMLSVVLTAEAAFVAGAAAQKGTTDMPMLSWMGREEAVRRDRDVASRILREDKSLSHCVEVKDLLSLRGVSETRSSEEACGTAPRLLNSKTSSGESNGKGRGLLSLRGVSETWSSEEACGTAPRLLNSKTPSGESN